MILAVRFLGWWVYVTRTQRLERWPPTIGEEKVTLNHLKCFSKSTQFYIWGNVYWNHISIYIYVCIYMYIYDLPRDSGKMSVWSVSQNRSKIPPAFITGCRILMWSSEKSHSKKSLKVVSSASQNMSIFLPFFVQWLFFPLKNTIWLLMFAPRVFFCFRSCKLLGFFKIKWLEESCWHRLSG